MLHLTAVSRKQGVPDDSGAFPFSVPLIRSLRRLVFEAPLTFFVGENGSGKSTLLEGIAAAAGLPAVGSESVQNDATLAAQRQLAKALTLSWTHRTHRGFFLRSEDFFGFAKRVAQLRSEMQQRLTALEVEYTDRSAWAHGLAAGPANSSLAELQERYGVDLDANSHGQSFLRVFSARFVPGGLYLLDEPETPLSPQSQLALMSMLHDMLRQDAQFIIATHSPILLAFPGAQIYSFDRAPPELVPYDQLEHVVLTRSFLNDRERYFRHLFSDDATS